MNGYNVNQPLVAPHHYAALSVLPSNWPVFFQGINPIALQQSGIQNFDLAGFVQRKLLKYIISMVQPNAAKPVVIMYQIVSSHDFQNQEFANIVIMTMKAIDKLLARQLPLEVAVEEAHKNATARWLVNYLKANAHYFGLTHEDNAAIGRIENNVRAFEQKFMGPQPAQTNTGYGSYGTYSNNQHAYGHQQPSYNQSPVDINSVVGSLYSSSGPANYSNPTVGDIGLNSGVILSALDTVDIPPQHIPQSESGLQSVDPGKIAEQYMTPFIAPVSDFIADEPTIQPEPVSPPVPEPVPVTEEVPQVNNQTEEPAMHTDQNVSTFPDVVELKGDKVEFEKHDLRRLLRNGNPLVDTAFTGVEVINSLANTTIDTDDSDRKVYGAVEGETTDSPDIGISDLKPVRFPKENRTVATDDDLRIWLAGETNNVTRTVIATVTYHEVTDIGDLTDTIKDLFKDVKSHTDIAAVITETLNHCSDDVVREVIKVVDRRMTSIVVDKINFELGLPGTMSSYYDSIDDVLKYLLENVNEISYMHIADAAEECLLKALSGLKYGFLEDNVVVCMTRATSGQFPYIINTTSSETGRIARVNPLVTPDLHNAITKIFEYVNAINDDLGQLIRKVYLMTYDGAKISLHRCPFTNCYNVVKETV